MKKLIILGWLLLGSILSTHSQELQLERQVSQQEALAIAQKQFVGQDVDYFLLNGSTSATWDIFVDAEPMKGWQHDTYIVSIPKSIGVNDVVVPNKVLQKSPRFGNYTPLLVKNRYGSNANSKPRVAKSSSSNAANPVASRTYAVILSGGASPIYNYERYWNDCSFVYQTLVNKYGVPKENIYPIMSDGENPAADMRSTTGTFVSQPLDLDFDGVADIKLAATKVNVKNTLATLANKLRKDDHLLLFVIDHGGTNDKNSSSYICLWNNERLQDTELALMLKPFTASLVNVNVVLGQCYAGGFNDDLEMVGCVVSSAAQGNESSWSCLDIPYDEFVYQWTCAVNGATHTGVPVNADADNNGRVTMEEVFDYAKANDRKIGIENPVYTSTPLSVGEDLAFNHLAPSVDLYIPDNFGDTGKEPNTTEPNYWKSPSIWVRNQPDSIYGHENPIYSSDHRTAFIYVRVHNRGKERFDGRNKWLIVYWAKASTGLKAASWKGREVDEDEEVTGGYLPIPRIKSVIEPGEYVDMELPWALPPISENAHYCLLAKISDLSYDDGYIPGETYFPVLGSNDIAQKNVTIIRKEDLSKGVDVFVRNVASTAKTYSLELVPETTLDKNLYSMAKVKMEMSQKIYDAWERGGLVSQDLEIPANQPNGVNRVVKFVSPQSQVQKIQMKADEFDVVRVKFDFFKPELRSRYYTFDLIQKDENGNIVGGETFVVESPTDLGPVDIKPIPIPGGSTELKTDTTAYKSFKWMDRTGETLSEEKSVVVNPKATGNEYTVMAATEEGDVATGYINLEDVNGIKSVAVPNAKSLEVTLKVSAPALATVAVTSVIDGTSKVSCPVPDGADSVTLDVSSLASGVYVVSYSVNSELVDQNKIKIE